MEGSAVAKFEELSQHLPIGTEENHENHQSGQQSPAQDLNLGPFAEK